MGDLLFSIAQLARQLGGAAGDPAQRAEPGHAPDPPGPSGWERDMSQAASAVEWFARAEGPRVVLVGKLIVSKGVDLLLAAWPLVHASNPGARLLVVGFGEYAGALQRLWAALASGACARPRRRCGPGNRGFLDSKNEPRRDPYRD